MNAYFLAHPARVLGEPVIGNGMYGSATLTVRSEDLSVTGVRLALGEAEAQMLLLPGPNERATVVERRKLDAPPMVIDSRVYIPVRAASELLGTEVQWSGSEPAVYIGVTPAAEEPAH